MRGPLIHGGALEEQAGKVGVVELEVTLVVELEEGGREGVVVLQVEIVQLRLRGSVPTVLTYVHLRTETLHKFPFSFFSYVLSSELWKKPQIRENLSI